MSTIKVTTLSTADGAYSVPAETLARASCKAWVNFNGTGTVAIRRAFNVSSITDNGTGDYTVNFTNAMVDANYSFFGGCNTYSRVFAGYGSQTASSARMACTISTTGVLEDNTGMFASFFS